MDITTEAVRLGLDLAQVRAQVASTNIARADMPGASLARADFADAVGLLRAAVHDGDAAARLGAMTPATLQAEVHETGTTASSADLADEVAELSSQGVQYRALADGLSRRFALMQLAITGK